MAAISSSFRAVEHRGNWEDIRRADARGCVQDVFLAIMQYLETRPASSFADIERLLRRDGCRTYLIAKAADPAGPDYPPFFRTIFKVYELHLIMTTPDEAEKERICCAGTEEVNLSRLTEETGVYVDSITGKYKISEAILSRI
jgi:hypothetical protein